MKIKERNTEVEGAELVHSDRSSKGAIRPLKAGHAGSDSKSAVDRIDLEMAKAILEITKDEPKKDLEAIKRKYANGQFPQDLAEKVAPALSEAVSNLQILNKDESKAA